MNRPSRSDLVCACATFCLPALFLGGCVDDDAGPLDEDSGTSTLTLNSADALVAYHDGFSGGTGHVVSVPAGIDCAIAADGTATGSCSATFDKDITVQLQATADSETSFSGWFDAASGSDFDYEQTQGFAASGEVLGPTLALDVDDGRQLVVFASFVIPPQ